MELIDYLQILTRRKWVIILTTIVATIVATLGVMQMPVKYTAITKIRVLTARVGGNDYVEYNITYAERLVNTYVQMVNSGPILDQLSQSVGISPENLALNINAKLIPATELIEIDFTDEDPARAQFAVNKLADLLVSESKKLYSGDANPANIYVAEPAGIPQKPSSTSPFVLIGLGLLAGLVGGLGLAFLFESLDTRIYTTKQIENLTQLPVLGDIPDNRERHTENGLFTDSRLHIEAFRRLHTNIFSHAQNETLQAFLITSPVTQDGKSTVAANLALSLAQANHNVIVVDANLRWPMIHMMFNLKNVRGLSDVLGQKAKLADVIQPTQYPEIYVITSGKLPDNPVELLESDQMALLIAQLKQQYDVVLLDSPASLTVTDPAVIATNVDGVLLVVRQAWVRREVLQATLKHLTNVHANLVGVIANRTELGAGSRFFKKGRLVTLSVPASNGSGVKKKRGQVEDEIRILTTKMDTLVDTLTKLQQSGAQTKPVQPPPVQQLEQMDHQPEDNISSKLDDLLDSLRK